ncbi:MAG: HEAT repeat domain-containing protein [Candidatus Hodarchaeota archaeon]
MLRRITFLSLASILIPSVSFAYLVGCLYFENEKKFRPLSFEEMKKIPTAFIGNYAIFKTEIEEVSLVRKTVTKSGQHSYLKLKCSGMGDYRNRIDILINPTDFKVYPTIGEISKKLLPIIDKPILLYGYITAAGSNSTEKEATINVYAISGPSEKIPKRIFSQLIEDGPKMLSQNKIKKLNELFSELLKEQREIIDIQVLEAFTCLRYWVLNRSREKGVKWKGLYKKIVNSANSEATPMLLRILKDYEPLTRYYAADILGKIGDKRALDDLRQLHKYDRNKKVRKHAARAYKQILSRNRSLDQSVD